LLKLVKQQELVFLLVKHSTLVYGCFFEQRAKAKSTNLNITIAKFKFKKLGEVNYCLWIMLVNSIQRANLTFV